MNNLLFIIVVATAISIILNIFLKRHHIPPIIGYIISGSLISYFFNLSYQHESLHVVGEFGIVFLMFTIALEFSIAHLKAMKREVFLFGGLQVILSLLIISFIAHHFFGIAVKPAIILGAALALSSTAIVLKILNESGEISRPYGRKALGVLLFQDIAVIPIFLMITAFSDHSKSVGDLLFQTFIDALIALGILYIIGRYLLNRFLAWVTSTNSSEIFIAAILLIVVGSSLLAHYFGFSYSLGAFIAGIMIAETKYKFQVESDLIPFRDILLGVFFVTVGMQINFHFLFENIGTILAVLFAVMALKGAIILAFLRFFANTKTSLKTAITLSQVGEFSFAVFEIARQNSIFGHDLGQTMIIAVVFSMILTPFIIKNLDRIVALLTPRSDDALPTPGNIHNDAEHVIVCGYSRIGNRVVRKLKQAGIPYIAIDNDYQLVKSGIEEGHHVLFGNASQKHILYQAGLKRAAAVIIAIDDEKKVKIITEAITAYAHMTNIIVKISDRESFALVEEIPLNNIIDENELIANEMVQKALTCNVGVIKR